MDNCLYCTADEKVMGSLIEVSKLNVTTFYLCKDQTYPGRSVVVLNRHAQEFFQLETEEMHLLAEDLAKVSGALERVLHPQKVNYAIYGDIVSHLHFHVAPKFKDGDCWGQPFNNNPDKKKFLSEEEYKKLVKSLQAAL